MKRFLLILLPIIFLAACSKDTSKQPQTEAQKDTEAVNIDYANLDDAIAFNMLAMTDFQDLNYDAGTVKLAIWSSKKLKWSELNKRPNGSYALVMKDSSSQRGNKLCTSGQVVEIKVDNSAKEKVYIGGMLDNKWKLTRFIAVKSTGNIVEGSRAKFCGIVTGQQHYSNSAGGVSHAVHLVGMFDLPENRNE